MKAITLTQPWASLVAMGAKRIETRSWRTPYRGRIAIHAAKGFPKWARETCNEPEFAAELGPDVLPVGVVIATAYLVCCLPTRELQLNRMILFADELRTRDREIVFDGDERRFGDYSIGRWGWLLADIEELKVPIPVKGALGLWEWNEGGA